MLPTSHPAPIRSEVDMAFVDRAALADAFVDFSTAASRLESSYSQLRDEVTHLRATLAERNRALRSSQAENANMKLALCQIVDSLPCGVLVLDSGHKIELVNPEARRLLDIADDHVGDLADLPEPCRTPICNALATPAPACGEDEFYLSGPGESRWLALRVRHLLEKPHAASIEGRRGEGERRRTVLILRDTTNQKKLEEEREAARNVVALAEMATVLAHEIRNPLASLELFGGLIAQQNPGSAEYVSQLCAGIRSLSSTVNNILMFHGGCPMQGARIDLTATLRSTVEFLGPLAKQNRIKLSLHEQTATAVLLGDESGLRQVFLNLALNAFRHTEAGGNLRIVSRRIECSGVARALVEFCDNGCGISPEVLPHIFDPGFSANGQTPGLGLTVCRKIIEQHGGTLTVNSEVGRGSTFTIEIPSE